MLQAFAQEPAGPPAASPDSQAQAEIEANTAAMLEAYQEEANEDDDQVAPLPSELAEQGGQATADGGEATDTGAGKDQTAKAPGEKGADDRLIKVKGLDKQQLCIDLLMVGCVQSFVDFFYITHRKSVPNENPLEQETKDVAIPEETLIFLKETLETAESARRSKNYQHCFESYNVLAEYFEKVPDLKSAMYFYQRCADVATEVDARESIAKANLNLGM